MATTIEVVVEELCNNTVARTPIIKPAIGFVMRFFDENALTVKKKHFLMEVTMGLVA